MYFFFPGPMCAPRDVNLRGPVAAEQAVDTRLSQKSSEHARTYCNCLHTFLNYNGRKNKDKKNPKRFNVHGVIFVWMAILTYTVLAVF